MKRSPRFLVLVALAAAPHIGLAVCFPATGLAQMPRYGALVDLAWRPIDGHAYAVTSSGDVFANPGYCGQWAWTGHLPASEIPVRILDGDFGGELTIGCASGAFYALSGNLPLISLAACSSIVGVAGGALIDVAWRHGGGAYVVTTRGEILAAPGGCGPWALVGSLPSGELPACILDGDISSSIDIGCRSGNFYTVAGAIPSVTTSSCSSLGGLLQGDLVDIAWRRADGHAYAVTSVGDIFTNPGSCGIWSLAGTLPPGEQPACVLDGDVGGSMDIGCRSGRAFTVQGTSTSVTVVYCSGLQDVPIPIRPASWGRIKGMYR